MTRASTSAIRRAGEGDVARIRDIYNQAILHTVATFDTDVKTESYMADWFSRHGDGHPVFVYEVEGMVVGWASLSPWSDRCAYSSTAEVSVYVDEAFQKRGIGTALLAHLLDIARTLPLHTLISRIAGDNAGSVRLHERFGFEHIGTMREVGFKFSKLRDVDLYQYFLSFTPVGA